MITIYSYLFNRNLQDGHYGVIYQNALRSWQQLDPAPDIILLGREDEIAADCARLGVRFVPVTCTASGAPLLRETIEVADAAARYPVRMFTCMDMLFSQDLITAVRYVQQFLSAFLLVGRRFELTITDALDFSNGTMAQLTQRARSTCDLSHGVVVSYLIYSHNWWPEMPDFLGGWGVGDNWMVLEALKRGVPVIDVTGLIPAIHQSHPMTEGLQEKFEYNKQFLSDDFIYAGVHTASFVTHQYQVNPQVVIQQDGAHVHRGVKEPVTMSCHPVYGRGGMVMLTGEHI